MTDRLIARVRFVDGSERDVHETPAGEQYAVGEDGERVYGGCVLTEAAEALTPVVIPRRPDTGALRCQRAVRLERARGKGYA